MRHGAIPLTLLALAAACHAQPATYATAPPNTGTIRSWGDDAMRGTMTAWEQTYRTLHPEIAFDDKLLGSATGMAGIITSSSDFALMGRPVTANEVIGFEWVFRVKPLGIQVMNGGLKAEGKSPALAVFVSRDNPSQQISMAQLAAILGCPVGPKQPVTWALAGAEGAWKNRPVHAFLYDDQTGTGSFLQQAIQGTKDCWNWDVVKEFRDKKRADGTVYPAAEQIADALKHDPNGLAISTLSYAGAGLKALPVTVSGVAVQLTPESITGGVYPLRRGVYIYTNRAKDMPVDPILKTFLDFILSPAGQAVVKAQADFLPLNPSVALAQSKKLE